MLYHCYVKVSIAGRMHIELNPLPVYVLSHAEVAKSIKIDEGAIAQKPRLQEGMFVLLVLSTR